MTYDEAVATLSRVARAWYTMHRTDINPNVRTFAKKPQAALRTVTDEAERLKHQLEVARHDVHQNAEFILEYKARAERAETALRECWDLLPKIGRGASWADAECLVQEQRAALAPTPTEDRCCCLNHSTWCCPVHATDPWENYPGEK